MVIYVCYFCKCAFCRNRNINQLTNQSNISSNSCYIIVIFTVIITIIFVIVIIYLQLLLSSSLLSSSKRVFGTKANSDKESLNIFEQEIQTFIVKGSMYNTMPIVKAGHRIVQLSILAQSESLKVYLA
jgi:hypothetical protein